MPFFDPGIAERGVSYYRRGAVEATEWTEHSILARVSGAETYTTGLCCDDDSLQQAVYLWCDCPFVAAFDQPCKHLWAVVQMADALGALGALGRHRLHKVHLAVDPDEFVEHPHAPRRKPAVSGSSRSSAEVPLPPEPTLEGPAELLCSLDPALVRSSGQLALSAWIRPRGGRYGRFSGGRAQAVELDESDQWLLGALGGQAASGGLYPLIRSARDSKQFFMRLCKERRLVYWSSSESMAPDDAQPLTFDRGAAWRLRLVGQPRDGDLLVSGELFRSVGRKQQTRPLQEAEFLLLSGMVGFSEHIATLNLEDEGTWAWIRELRSSSPVEIPAEAVESFLDEQLTPHWGPELVLSDELGFVRDSVEPRPWLVLRVAERGQQIGGHVELEYGSRRVRMPHHAPVVVELAERRIHVRNPTAEARFADELRAVGFQCVGLPAVPGGEEERMPGGAAASISAEDAPEAIAQLLQSGWRVTANGKPYRHMKRFSARISSGQNWFEVDGGLEFDGQTLGMPALLRAVRRGERVLQLGDGSVGLLPEAWLTRLGMLGGQQDGDKLQVPRSQLLVLEELAGAGAGFSVDAAFDRLRNELRGFQALTPARAPSKFRGQLRDYQRQGLAWMQLLERLGFGGCLADDMGLGKTVQVLALLLGRNRRRRSLPPSLVVAPSSVVFNWLAEAQRFAPTLCVVAHAGATRAPLEVTLEIADVIVTSYSLLRREAAAFTAAAFDYVILDEAQAIKNYETETAKVARALKAGARLTMTGTPIENHLGELASQLEFLNPGILGSSPRLSRALMSGKADAESLKLVQRTVKPFLLRRTKLEVARELPDRIEQNVFVELGSRERRRYDELLQYYRLRVESQVASVGLARSTPHVLEALLRLRQAACHPGLLDEGRRAEPSAKLDRVLEEIERIGELGERCLVFSQFTTFLGILRERLDARGVRYEYLDGQSRQRQQIVERFQSPGGAPVFLISLLAGGVGLNLTAAEHVLLLDPWWNPAVEAQAIDRSHRIGQTRTVLAYRLIARGTVEEKVLALQGEKRALAQAILGDEAGLGGKLTREDLEAILS